MLIYDNYFRSLSIEKLKELLKQYEFEQENGLGNNYMKIISLKRIINEKENN